MNIDKILKFAEEFHSFMTASLPLPDDHWIYDKEPDDSPPPCIKEKDNTEKEIIEAARWAIRGATMDGKEMDFDPDALVKNIVYSLLGPRKPLPKKANDGDVFYPGEKVFVGPLYDDKDPSYRKFYRPGTIVEVQKPHETLDDFVKVEWEGKIEDMDPDSVIKKEDMKPENLDKVRYD